MDTKKTLTGAMAMYYGTATDKKLRMRIAFPNELVESLKLIGRRIAVSRLDPETWQLKVSDRGSRVIHEGRHHFINSSKTLGYDTPFGVTPVEFVVVDTELANMMRVTLDKTKLEPLQYRPQLARSDMRTISTGRAPGGLPASYRVRTEPVDGIFQTYVAASCNVCGEITELHWNTGGNHPDFIAKKFRGMGWQFDPYKPKRCICPVCRGRGRPTPSTETIIDNAVVGLTTVVKNTNSQEEPMDSPKPSATTLVTHVETPRPLTAHEKQKIRLLLDTHFDDDKGRYLEGYDDKRVGEEVHVPWALVTELRELAYGPLKDDPQVVAFKAEASALRQEFTTLSNALETVRQRVTAIEGRLVNVEARAKKL